ncbi:MAG: hypothetical protein IJ831_10420 [Spirochaetales bacterium]|nr:hypothetical protein [Spirochaetales bacterium]
MKAPNGEPTKLTVRQWLLVRTPNLIRWFGNWIFGEKSVVELIDMSGIDLSSQGINIKEISQLKEWLTKNLVGKTIKNVNNSIPTQFTNKGIKDSLKKRGYEQRNAYSVLENLLEKAVYYDFEKNDGKKKHAHLYGQDVYYAALKFNERIFSVKIKCDINLKSFDSTYKDHKVSEIHIADYTAQGLNSEKSRSPSYISAINNLTIRDLVGDVKPDFSKAIGENGEPLAAFHGSPSTFTVFDPRKGLNTDAIWHSSSRVAASHWSGTSISTRFNPALIERIENASTIEELKIHGEEDYGLIDKKSIKRAIKGQLAESLNGGHEITDRLVLIKNEDDLLAYEIRKGTVDSEATIPLVGARHKAELQLNNIINRIFVNKYGSDIDSHPFYDTSEGETAPIQDKDLTPEEEITGTRDQSRSRSRDANVQNIGLQLSPTQSLRMLNSGYYLTDQLVDKIAEGGLAADEDMQKIFQKEQEDRQLIRQFNLLAEASKYNDTQKDSFIEETINRNEGIRPCRDWSTDAQRKLLIMPI